MRRSGSAERPGVAVLRSRPVLGLVTACHPLPCLAVTAFASGYAVAVGLAAARVGLFAAAILAGQLSIGWCNDAVDAGRDTLAGRRDKPVPAGLVGRRTVALAAAAALLLCVGLSSALGVIPAAVHLVAVACGWAYDLGLKATPASALAYLIAFGALPAVATTAVADPFRPPLGVLGGAALLGFAAHCANTVGDTVADAATGVRGLPQRLGPHRSLQATALAVGAAAAVLLAGVLTGPGHPRPAGVALLTGGVVLAAAALVVTLCPAGGPLTGRLLGGRTAFRVTLAAVAVVVAGLLVGTAEAGTGTRPTVPPGGTQRGLP